MENVAVIRGNRIIFQGFSLSAQANDIIWVRGANGSGKSTLLRIVAQLLPNVSGKVSVEGNMALSDENLGLDSNLPLEKALAFWANMDGANADNQYNALAAMDLTALTDVPVRYLSSGQRRRASLARVIASGADIWLLDEPYNGLDSANCARLDQALLRHAGSGGIALVAAHQSPSINVTDSITLGTGRKAA
ncbi:heme ABC exporter ATP-binding protein CcmA [Sphingorhabdus arenilitoris]|uniref:Heme ABC exporter ATP-binding protein CcmA n=1 Tax=Sphingorhabdus arenilitoris TaxID=1490041 RepID=A0ABV8RGN9_9SPHN